MRTRFYAAVVSAMLLAVGTPLVAHHSFSAFNTETEKTITGVVNRFEWTNPHTWIWVDVQENGKTVTWGVEGMSPNYLSRRGWSKNTFKQGDKVTLTIRPMRDGSPGGMFVRGILADGKPVTFTATEQ
jgi:hypothetical protein